MSAQTTNPAGRWYVCALGPGATRKAPLRGGHPSVHKSETVVELAIAEAGFTSYVPRMTHRFRNHRTQKIVVRSRILFTGYVFIVEPPDGMDWPRLGACDGVSRVLQMDGWALTCPPGYIEDLKAAQAAGRFDRDDVDPDGGRAKRHLARHRFAVGTPVRAKEGPFAGFSGLVEDVVGQGLIKVAISIFGRATPVEFERGMLEVL